MPVYGGPESVGGTPTRSELEAVLYDNGYSWELQPGSDVMVTTIGGLGPVAITDENAGGLIGDIGYVVSGYVYNKRDALGPLQSDWIGILANSSTTAVTTGQSFGTSANQDLIEVTGAGDVVVDANGGYSTTGAVADGPFTWPYIERYNFATGAWLSRVALPPYVDYSGTAQEWSAGVAIYYPNDRVTYGGVTYYLRVGVGYASGSAPSGGSQYWTTTQPAPVPFTAEGGITGVIGGKLYFGGGDGYLGGNLRIRGQEFFSYDPATGIFVRLADTPTNYADYSAYGVVDGKLYYFTYGLLVAVYGLLVAVFDPGTGAWTETSYTGAELPGDQVQGIEIDGKLWFVYNGAAFVFDPVALTVTRSSSTAFVISGGAGVCQAVLIGDSIRVDSAVGAYLYDPVGDVWTKRTDMFNVLRGASGGYGSEMVSVVHGGVPYALSGTRAVTSGDNRVGVYGLTGVALDEPRTAIAQDGVVADALVASRAITDRHHITAFVFLNDSISMATIPLTRVGPSTAIGIVTVALPAGFRLDVRLDTEVVTNGPSVTIYEINQTTWAVDSLSHIGFTGGALTIPAFTNLSTVLTTDAGSSNTTTVIDTNGFGIASDDKAGLFLVTVTLQNLL